MLIAVDFDGTIVEHRYPEIGAPIPFALETLLRLQREGHLLVLWTVREGKRLDEAVMYCTDRGLTFYAVNKSHPEENPLTAPRKPIVDLFIDDRNFGGMPDWGLIYQAIADDRHDQLFDNLDAMMDNTTTRRHHPLWKRLFDR